MGKKFQEWLMTLPAKPTRVGMLNEVFNLVGDDVPTALYILFDEEVDLEPMLQDGLESVRETN